MFPTLLIPFSNSEFQKKRPTTVDLEIKFRKYTSLFFFRCLGCALVCVCVWCDVLFDWVDRLRWLGLWLCGFMSTVDRESVTGCGVGLCYVMNCFGGWLGTIVLWFDWDDSLLDCGILQVHCGICSCLFSLLAVQTGCIYKKGNLGHQGVSLGHQG